MLHHYITALNRLNKIVSAIFVSVMCSLLPEDLHSELISTSKSYAQLFKTNDVVS